MNERNSLKQVNLYYIKSKFNDIIINLCVRLIKERFKILIVTNSIKENDELDDFLWVEKKESFIPHRKFSDPYYKDERITLFCGDQDQIKSFKGFDILLVSPNVFVKELFNFNKLFLFSNFVDDKHISVHKKKLQRSRFKIKTLIEKQNHKWEVF